MTGALEGTKVLDLSRLAPGPFCTMLLGDMGADVLLVEAPPEYLHSATSPSGPPSEVELRNQAANALRRNKRSIVINLRDTAGREAFYKLAKDADVIVEGFRPGVVQRLGVDYDTIKKTNPRVVYCSLSG